MSTQPLSRKSNWPALLDLFIEEKRSQPFDWKTNNCAFSASDWLAIVTGDDPAEALRKRVTSPLTAARVLKKHGGIEAIIEKSCQLRGWPEIAPRLAQRGDLATVGVDEAGLVSGGSASAEIAVGVIVGKFVAYAGSDGLLFVQKALARRVWRVG